MDTNNLILIISGFVSTTITSWVIVWKLVMKYQIEIIRQFQMDLVDTRSELAKQRWRLDNLLAWLRLNDVEVPMSIIYGDSANDSKQNTN